MRQRDNLRERRAEQSPLLEMINQPNCEEGRDHRTRAQVPSPAPSLLRVRIDESIWSRGAKPQHVAMLEPLSPANPLAVDVCARVGFEIDQVVASARIPYYSMTISDVRIGKAQRRTFGIADRGFIALQHEQPSTMRLAIDREQTRGLRPLQHLRLLSRGALRTADIQKTNAVPFEGGEAGVSVQYGSCPLELLPPFSACNFARSC